MYRQLNLLALVSIAAAASTSDATVTSAPDTTTNPYETYPEVPRTASINGFADPIYSDLPECAKGCVDQDTGVTPCPYWDTGCLCIMSNFAGSIAECVADACVGEDVSDMRSLATSICSSAGLPVPYWFIPLSDSIALNNAAEATLTSESSSETTSSEISVTSEIPSSTQETSESSTETSTSETSTSETSETSETSTSTAETTSVSTTSSPESSITSAPDTTTNPYETYPEVPRTASINGFADPIYSELPECAKDCVDQDTGVTPCPYWDTGCLCVMSNFAGSIAECVAEACVGEDVSEMTSLATSICSSAGVPDPYWFIPATDAAALEDAAAMTETSSSISESEMSSSTVSEVSSEVTLSEMVSETSDIVSEETSDIVSETSSEIVSETSSETSAAPSSAAPSSAAPSSAATSSAAPSSVSSSAPPPPPSNSTSECSVCTNYPTTYTTVTDNVTVTTSCEVIVTTNSKGLTTSTSTYLDTTVITVTSCSNGHCSEVPVTTGLTTVTEDSTTYTTYCPTDEEKATGTKAGGESKATGTKASPESKETTTKAGTKSGADTTLAAGSSETVAAASTIAVETFEGSGSSNNQPLILIGMITMLGLLV